MYGHTSRIWRVEQLPNKEDDGSIILASVSEDATCKVWSVNSESQKEITTFKGHLGRNVRALSTLGDVIATGGEDGSVKIWHLSKIISL